MRTLKILLLGITLTASTIAFADVVPIVDGYSNDNSQNQDQNAGQNTASNQNNNVQTFGTDQNSTAQNNNSDSSSQVSNDNSQSMGSSLSQSQRIAILEKQVNNLKQMLSQMNSLQTQLQTMQGQLDVQTHGLQTLQDQVKNQYQDLDQRISKQAMAAAPAPVNATTADTTDTAAAKPKMKHVVAATDDSAVPAADNSATTDTQHRVDAVNQLDNSSDTTTANNTDQGAYQAAFNSLKSKQYAAAATSFQKFLKKYPNSKNNVNAHYWLGQLYLLQGQPDKAITQLKIILKNNPGDTKVPDAMMQLGLAYFAKGDMTNAKAQLNKVQQNYPNSPAAKLAQTRLQQMAQIDSSNAASSAPSASN